MLVIILSGLVHPGFDSAIFQGKRLKIKENVILFITSSTGMEVELVVAVIAIIVWLFFFCNLIPRSKSKRITRVTSKGKRDDCMYFEKDVQSLHELEETVQDRMIENDVDLDLSYMFFIILN